MDQNGHRVSTLYNITTFLSWFDENASEHVSNSTNRGIVLCVGGPALVIYVSPTEEELFKVGMTIQPWTAFLSKLAVTRDTTPNCKNGR